MENRKSVKSLEIYDPKIEGYLMYKYIVCEGLLSPNSIPAHLSEPFNINVEHLRISSDWADLELLDKTLQVIDKIKLNSITSIDTNVNKESSLSSSTSSLSSAAASSASPILSSQNTQNIPPQLMRSNSISGKAGSLLGLSSDSSNSNDSPLAATGSKKANMLLGLEEEEKQSSKSPLKKSSVVNNSSASPKFGLLARSASNTLLNANIKKDKDDVPSSPSQSSFLMSSSPNASSLSMSVGGSGGSSLSLSGSSKETSILTSSTSSLSSSSNSFLGKEGNSGTSGIGSRSNSGNSAIGLNHYNQGFSIQTKSANYVFNSRDKDELNIILDSVKMVSSGKPYHEPSIQTFDAITEALLIANLCKAPVIPPLPTSSPPPPPLLTLNQSS